MVRIQRATQKIFADNAGSQQITEFGTAKTDTPVYTDQVSVIQNANYLSGWSSALLPDKSPWQEDMNALFYAITTQLAYLYQEGQPEYDAGTTYYKGALVKNIDNQGNVTIYKSLIDNNTGNALTDDNYWRVYQSDSSTGIAMYEIGLPQPTLSNTLLSNEIWLEGQEVSRTTYANLFAIYGTIYGVGDGSSTFNLPDCRNRVMWGSTSFGYISAGLPNATGTFTAGHHNVGQISASGIVYEISRNGPGDNGTYNEKTNALYGIDLSRSSGIWGNSSTVQPPAIKVRVKTRYQ